jgi:filamentous hemagglutinin family protein
MLLRFACILVLLAFLAPALPALSQTSITLDGSIGGPAGAVGPTAPNVWELPGNLGARAGSNLFYSFGSFRVGPGDSAVFLPDPMDATPLSNVIARVTGGQPSTIDGTLRSLIPDADLYLLNPAGVLFGGAAAIDVPRSLYVSTAHRLEFANTSDFLDLVDPANPTLSVEPPEAFGFDGGAPAGEIVFGNAGAGARFYSVPDGRTFTAVGGDVTVTNRAQIQAPGGRVQLAAVGSAAMVVPLDLAQLDVAPDSATSLGEVRVEARSSLGALPFDPNAPQGTVVIRAGRFVLDDRSFVRAGGQIPGSGAAVDVQAAEQVVVSNQSDLRSDGQGALASGGVSVRADRITVSGGSFVRTRDFAFAPGDADAGDVVLEAGAIRIESGSVVEATTDGGGDAGDVSITTGDLTLEDGEIRTVTRSTGQAGSIDIGATGTVAIARGSIASTSSTSAFGGSIAIAADAIEVTGGESQIITSNDVTAPPPPGDEDMPEGGITLAAGSIRVVDGGFVGTQTSGTRAGGDISLEADSIEILDGGIDASMDPRESAIEASTSGSGTGGSIQLDGGDLRIGRSAGSDRAGRLATAVRTGASGTSGDVDVTADSVTVDGGGQISTTTVGSGGSGSIAIVATGDVLLQGDDVADDGTTIIPSGVFTRAGTGVMLSTADAGSVSIEAANIDVLDGAEISTRAIGSGASGDVTLTATGAVKVAGSSGQSSAVTARALEGQGGDVVIESDALEVTDGGRIDVSTSGSGSGGQLVVRTGDLLVQGATPLGVGSIMTARADGVGDAQGIDIEASRSVEVGQDGEITAASGSAGGSPGNIDITAPVIGVDGGRVTTQAGFTAGGDITLTGGALVRIGAGAEVSARSASGDAGNILVQAPAVAVHDSQIVADADEYGGEITLRGAESILLERSSVEAFSRGGSGPVGGTAGGNVFIEGGGVVLNQARIAADGFGNADGGNVLLSGDVVLQSTDTQVTYSSQLGRAGTFIVNSPYTEVTGDLVALPENFLDASALLEEACLARDAPSGSFSVRETGELPASPDAPLTLEPGGDESKSRCDP